MKSSKIVNSHNLTVIIRLTKLVVSVADEACGVVWDLIFNHQKNLIELILISQFPRTEPCKSLMLETLSGLGSGYMWGIDWALLLGT